MKTGEELREQIMDVLEKHYYGRNFIERRCADDLMALIHSELYEAYQDGVAVTLVTPTMTTLENSYCRPETVQEWVECLPWMFEDEIVHGIVGRSFLAFGDGTLSKEPREGMTELTVTQFLDPLHDRITPWRLEEVGFISCASPDMMMMDTAHGILCVSEGGVWMNHMRVMYNLTTFTDLLSLVRMLTPPSND